MPRARQHRAVIWKRRDSEVPYTDAWSFYEWLGERPRATLTKEQLEVAVICDLRQEVNSGGFDSYFRYRGGNSAQLALAALPGVLGQEWADLLQAAMSQLGTDYPIDVDVRERLVDGPGVGEALHALDAGFYDLEASTEADALLTAHLTSGTSPASST